MLKIVSLLVGTSRPVIIVLFIIRINKNGAATNPTVVSAHKIVQVREHSIPKSSMPDWTPKIVSAVKPGIKMPAMQNFNVDQMNLFFSAITQFEALGSMWNMTPIPVLQGTKTYDFVILSDQVFRIAL